MAKRVSINLFQSILVVGLSGLAALTTIAVHFAWTSLLAPLDLADERISARPVEPRFASLQAPETRPVEVNLLLRRPLFSRNRMPPSSPEPIPLEAPAPAVAATDDGPAPSYIVGGVFVSPSMRKTLLRQEPHGPGRWLSQGETTPDGWVIESIRPDGVTIVRGTREIAFTLHGSIR